MPYTIEELQPKARAVLDAEARDDPRATWLYLMLGFQLELPLARVREGVQMLANGVMPE